jgi:translation initiation factor 2 beta subunit (eIF-2beta)/eIF-5
LNESQFCIEGAFCTRKAVYDSRSVQIYKSHALVPASADAKSVDKVALATETWKNLKAALDGLKAKVEELPPVEDDEEEEEEEPPPSKRSKTEAQPKTKAKKKQKVTIIDPYNIWLHTIRRSDDPEDDQEGMEAQELKKTRGGKLSQLGLSGILNGLAGVQDGLVDTRQCDPKEGIDPKAVIPTANNVPLMELKQFATQFHKAVQTRIQADVLVTTPIRIQQMLAPNMQSSEFKAIRRRIYDTVILGKGLAQPEGSDIPTAATGGTHDIDKFKKCKSCGNNDQSVFVLDRKNGDVICSNCGTVASESLMHEGSQFRKFEGEVDRNHHGDMANPLYSNAHNMG